MDDLSADPVSAPDFQWRQELAAAQALFAGGKLAEAEAAYRALIDLDEQRLESYVGVSQCARARGDPAASLLIFDKAARVHPAHAGIQSERAADLLRLGRLEAAELAYLALLRLGLAWTGPARMGLGQCARRRGNGGAALAHFQAAAAAAPFDPWPRVEAAAEALALGRAAESEALLSEALALDPGCVPALARLAAQTMETDPERAYALYLRASAASPQDAALRIGIVEALVAQGRLPEALRNILALEPEFAAVPEIIARRLNLLRETGDLHEALRLGREMNARMPRHFWIWVERCNTELMLGGDADVEACLEAAPAGTAAEAATVRRLAGALAARRWQLDDARTHYEAAAALNQADQRIQSDLTRNRLLLLDLEGAKASLRRFCELNASSPYNPMNIAQTHYGQIIHECSFDPAALAELAALLFLQPAERMAALCATVRDEPGNTAAAISLLLAMRQDGAFAAAAPGAAAKVPKHIFQFWDAGEPPDEVAAAMQSWRDFNPEYSFSVYNDANAREFLAARFPPEVLLAYQRAREPAQKADIFRLAHLAASGGIHADVHDRCIAPVRGLLPRGAALVMYQEEMGTIGTNFIAAAPAQQVVLRALGLAANAINRGDRDIGWLATGPALLTRALAQCLAARDSPALPAGLVVLERQAVFATVAIHCAANYLRAARRRDL